MQTALILVTFQRRHDTPAGGSPARVLAPTSIYGVLLRHGEFVPPTPISALA